MQSVFSFRALLYFIYAVLLTAVLLYVRFPEEKLKAYCEKRIVHLLPGSSCKIDHIGYHFPLSSVFKTIRISRTVDGQESDFVVDQLIITPEPLKFWRTLNLKGKIYSGLLEAKLDFDTGAETFGLNNIHLEGVEAGALAASIGVIDREISGTCTFTGKYQAKNSKPADGVGAGKIQINDGSMALMQPILTLTTIEFEKIAANVTYQDGMLNLVEGELLGKEMNADFAGELRMISPLSNSNILLSGQLDPSESFLSSHPGQQQLVQRLLQRYKTTALPFKVGGTVKRPLFRFST